MKKNKNKEVKEKVKLAKTLDGLKHSVKVDKPKSPHHDLDKKIKSLEIYEKEIDVALKLKKDEDERIKKIRDLKQKVKDKNIKLHGENYWSKFVKVIKERMRGY